MMKSRREACGYADKLMRYDEEVSKAKCGKSHFGLTELKMLMDHIYGKPRGEYEELKFEGVVE